MGGGIVKKNGSFLIQRDLDFVYKKDVQKQNKPTNTFDQKKPIFIECKTGKQHRRIDWRLKTENFDKTQRKPNKIKSLQQTIYKEIKRTLICHFQRL